MDSLDVDTDNFIVQFEKLADWIYCTRTVNVIYINYLKGISGNRPLPYIGIMYAVEGEFESLITGDIHSSLPIGYMSIGNAHFGSATSPQKGKGGIWTVAMDVKDISYFDYLLKGPMIERTQIQNSELITKAYKNILFQFQHLRDNSSIKMKAAMLNLCAAVLDDLYDRKAQLNKENYILNLKKAVQYIKDNLSDQELTLKEITKEANMSASHLKRYFSAEYKCTPIQYLRQLRLEKGSILLRETKLPISEITFKAGFNDPYYFTRLFHEKFGKSPTAFRKAGG